MKRTLNIVGILILSLFVASCSTEPKKTEPIKKTSPLSQKDNNKTDVIEISSLEQFKSIMDNNPDRLLVFDLYADWCNPCKILSPIFKEIAKEQKDIASFYKINVDKNREVAGAFGVKGIPFIVFVKNNEGVHAMTGVQPKDSYVSAIKKFAGDKAVKK